MTIAKTRAYSRLLFALESKAPILPVGLHITSAATPDFQAKPSPVMHEFLSAGRTAGSLIFIIIPFLSIPITFAISISLLSTDKSAVSTCSHTIGKTIRNAMKEGIEVEGIQSHAKIINAATGTERISLEIGLVKTLNALLLPERSPQISPSITATENPLIILRMDTPTAFQKKSLVTQFKNSFTASIGRGILKSRFLLKILAAICHSRTQNRMDPAEKITFLKLSFIVEIVSR